MSTPAPPVPSLRKVKLINGLKATHSEQASKLQNKYVLETDLLEDIRNYSKLRAAAENQYAQTLLKITNQLLGKFQMKEDKEEDTRTPYGIWRKILMDTENLAKSRVEVARILTSDVSDSIKTLKGERAVTVKKCTSLHERLHEELMTSANEMVKSQKNYSELQKQTNQAHEVANESQERVSKGATGIFSSKARLGRALTKAVERKEVAEKRSTAARNEYLLYISAINAHQQKYYALDLPDLIAVQDANIYENFKEYYRVITNAEKEICRQEIQNIEGLERDIQELQRAHAIQVFLKENPVFTRCTPYEMMPFFGDEITAISHENEAGLALNKEARKWCNRMVQKQKLIRKKTKELAKLKQAVSTDNSLNAEPVIEKTDKNEKGEKPKTHEEMIEAVTEEIRHLEVIRTKAEGRIEALKQAGIDTDEWLQGALNEQGGEDNDDEEEDFDVQTGPQGHVYTDEYEDEFEEEWDVPSTAKSGYSEDSHSITSNDVTKIGTTAMVMYTFEMTSPEELSVEEGEEIDFLESHGDGWCKCRNKYGKIGYVPESYIDIRPRGDSSKALSEVISTSPSSSLTGSIDVSTEPPPIVAALVPPDPEPPENNQPEFICYARAIYDYEACDDEELGFREGDLIMVTSKEVDDGDDGWWEGVLNGTKGVFPKIVVEETSS